MAEWEIIRSHLVAVPEYLLGDTVEEVQAHMQEVADSKAREPKIGQLTFKDFVVDSRREVHGFFVNRKGKKIRFMKIAELHSQRRAA